jgi:hypothetical protein
MAKDRFSNQKRNNYENSFTPYTPAVKKTLVFNKNQRQLIKNMLFYKDKLSDWENNMLVNMTNSATYSEKQKIVLNKIYNKIKK